MTMRPDDNWEDGPSVTISPEIEEEDLTGTEAEEVYYRPRDREEKKGDREPKPRSPFSVRLIYTLIFSIIVLTLLVVYALFAGNRIDRIAAEQEAVWGPRIEALQNRLESVEERLKMLEESPKPVRKPSPQKKK